jgi:hypothetical protein
MATKRKHAGAVALGKLSAKARMKKIPPEQRAAIARHAAQARWAKAKVEVKAGKAKAEAKAKGGA